MPQPDQPSPEPLLHIISEGNWVKARQEGVLTDPSLESEGFVHCSYPNQVLTPANALFTGQAELILLIIDPSKLGSPLVVEDSYGSGTEFPHVYGPIEIDAVTGTVPFPANDDGCFSLPADL